MLIYAARWATTGRDGNTSSRVVTSRQYVLYMITVRCQASHGDRRPRRALPLNPNLGCNIHKNHRQFWLWSSKGRADFSEMRPVNKSYIRILSGRELGGKLGSNANYGSMPLY